MVGIDESGSAKWLTDTFTEAMKKKLTIAINTSEQAGGNDAMLNDLAAATMAYEYAKVEKKAVEAMEKVKADKYHNILGEAWSSEWGAVTAPASPELYKQQFSAELAEAFKSVGISTVTITPPSHKVVYSPVKAKDVPAAPTIVKSTQFHHLSTSFMHKGSNEAGVECKCGAVAVLERISDHLYCSSCLINVLDCQCVPKTNVPSVNVPPKAKLTLTPLEIVNDKYYCPNCGSEYDDYKCHDCGYPDNAEDNQYCPNCDEVYDGDYCYECGYPEADVGEQETDAFSVVEEEEKEWVDAKDKISNETNVLELS